MGMNRLPGSFSAERAASTRVFAFSWQRNGWLSRLVLGVVGIAAMALTLLLSVVFVAVALFGLAAAVIYLRWHARKLRKAMQPDVIEGQVRSRSVE
jgi:hypothetical protein